VPYDFNDPDIRHLVILTHVPTEVNQGDKGSIDLALVCEKDLEPWPCAAIKQYRSTVSVGESPVSADVLRAQLGRHRP